MARFKPRHWYEYPMPHMILIRQVATADLPHRVGPFPFKGANTFRAEFYRFREALRAGRTSSDPSLDTSRARTYYELAEILTLYIEESPPGSAQHYVVFDLHPIAATVFASDPVQREAHNVLRQRLRDSFPSAV